MMKRIAIFLSVVLLILLLAAPVGAMVSTNFHLDWYTPLTGSGGTSASTHYAIHLTVGQTVNGGQASTGYQTGLGFWYGRIIDNVIYVPLLFKPLP